MSESEGRVRPFSNATEYGAWRFRNCDQCRLAPTNVRGSKCVMEAAISYASIDDGTIIAEWAQRIGVPSDPSVTLWDCPERQPEQPRPMRGPYKPRERKEAEGQGTLDFTGGDKCETKS